MGRKNFSVIGRQDKRRPSRALHAAAERTSAEQRTGKQVIQFNGTQMPFGSAILCVRNAERKKCYCGTRKDARFICPLTPPPES
jgi:hypothetical protein